MATASHKLPLFKQFCAVVFALSAAACTTSTPNNSSATSPAPADGTITVSELRAYCPAVTVREGTAFFNNYAKGAEETADNLIYQAAITNNTRTCQYGNGQITMTVAMAGKIVPGPKFRPGTITMPIRVAVTQGEAVVYSKLHSKQVAVNDTSTATQFILEDPAVTFAQPTARDIQVFVGFDEGPAKKKKAQ